VPGTRPARGGIDKNALSVDPLCSNAERAAYAGRHITMSTMSETTSGSDTSNSAHASPDVDTRAPAVSGPRDTADVIIIGAGLSGLSAGIHAQMNGYR
jgi:hypothetical protein